MQTCKHGNTNLDLQKYNTVCILELYLEHECELYYRGENLTLFFYFLLWIHKIDIMYHQTAIRLNCPKFFFGVFYVFLKIHLSPLYNSNSYFPGILKIEV